MKKVSNITQGQLQDNVKVVIPKNVMEKINYLCTVIAAVEWSGVLFYSVKGTIKNPSKMVITLRDILPMDKGTIATTEFEYDERYVEYLMNDERRMEYKSGLIHSHNNMAVFYSATDQAELKTNSKAHNFYLSVVVNNKLDIIGRIGISALAETVVQTSYKGLDENGKPYDLEPASLKVKNEKLFYIDCDMVYEKPKSAIEEEFLDNVSTILKPKVKSYTKKTTPISNTPDYSGDDYRNWGYGSNDWGYGGYRNTLPATRFSKTTTAPTKTLTKTKTESEKDFESFLKGECKTFLLKCFGFYEEDGLDEIDLIEILEDLQAGILAGEVDVPTILEDFSFGFDVSYEEHFHNTVYGTELILTTIEEILDEHSKDFKFVGEIKNIIRKI